jgi:hypothetical protein
MTSRLHAAIPYVFVVFALICTLFLAMNTPPYMGVDEPAHVARAALTTLGRVAGERVRSGGETFAGGPVDTAIGAAETPFRPIIGNVGRKADAGDYAAAGRVRWDRRVAPSWYPGSAAYPPFLYLPASGGFALGKLLGWPVVQSLYLARMANAAACIAVGFSALLLAGRARLLFFAAMLLPMSLFLYATVTTDGLVIALSALACAVVAGALSEGRALARRDLVAAAIPFVLVAMTKPPYALMGLVLLAAPAERPRERLAAAFAPLALAFAWGLAMAAAVQTPLTRGVDPGGQVRFLLTHPAAVLSVAFTTLAGNAGFYAESFIGRLGWLDTVLPRPYHDAARLMLLLALGLSASWAWPARWRRLAWAAPAAALAAAGAVFAALYVAWSPVGAASVAGVQGRYFIPLVFAAGLALVSGPPLVGHAPAAERWRALAVGLVLAFPLLSALVIERAIVLRYYLD